MQVISQDSISDEQVVINLQQELSSEEIHLKSQAQQMEQQVQSYIK